MKKLMEYHIISGRSIETRRSYMASRGERKVRGARKAGSSSLRKIQANEREAVKRAARILNANFGDGFLLVTLKYTDARLPGSYEAAQQTAAAFLRGARRLHRQRTGEGLRYFAVTANWSPKRQAPARLHHHIVMDMASLDMLSELWPAGELHVLRVRQPGDLSRLAAYLVGNVAGREPGKKTWSTSKGLAKPIYTEPVEVEEAEGIEPLPGSFVIDAAPTYDEDGRVVGSWLLARVEEPPRVRGSMVILPRKKRGGRKKDDEAYLREMLQSDE